MFTPYKHISDGFQFLFMRKEYNIRNISSDLYLKQIDTNKPCMASIDNPKNKEFIWIVTYQQTINISNVIYSQYTIKNKKTGQYLYIDRDDEVRCKISTSSNKDNLFRTHRVNKSIPQYNLINDYIHTRCLDVDAINKLWINSCENTDSQGWAFIIPL